MPSYSATLYIEPSTIEQITVGTNYGDISISRSSVSGNYGVFTTTSIGWDGESSKQITISADGYNNYTGTLLFGGKARKWEDFYATMTEAVPKYVSNLSDGTNTYIIKDANAVKSVNNVQPINGNVTLSIPTQASDIGAQPTLVSGTNIKTINNTSLLGSGNIDIGGSGSSYSPNLFDYKWSDYEIADQSWIKADSFSWQDGTVYSDAYNHLVADISGITASTETVGSYTITYYQATDGHKVVLADQETIVSNIYTESGVAWYYILDTTNTRFKLPRTKKNKYTSGLGVKGNGKAMLLVDKMTTNQYSFHNGANGAMYVRNPYTSAPTLPQAWGGNSTAPSQNYLLGVSEDENNSGLKTTDLPEDTQYLYFYVGQFSQSATEQTAGLNSSLFNGKADLDLVNASVNASSTAKRNITTWGVPDYTAGVTKSFRTTYTADVNGWIYIYAYSNGNTSYTINGITNDFQTGNTGGYYVGASVLIPLKVGDTYSATLAGAVSRSSMIFYPMIGEV